LSNREGVLAFCADRLQGVKWRNWKMHLFDEQRDWHTPPHKLGTPKLIDLITEPKEEYRQSFIENTWAVTPITKIIAEFEAQTAH
jgi:arylsulfatase